MEYEFVDTVEQLGALVQEKRLQRGWTLEELATRSGLEHEFLVDVETQGTYAELGRATRLLRTLGVHPLILPAPPESKLDLDDNGVPVGQAQLRLSASRSHEYVLGYFDLDQFVWRVRDLYLNGVDPPFSYLDLEERARDEAGIELDGSSLRALSASVMQFIDCTLLGYPIDDSAGTGGTPAVVIVAFDSSEWIVQADFARVSLREGAPTWQSDR